MSTPSKQKIQAIRTYLINKIVELFTEKTNKEILKAEGQHAATLRKIEKTRNKINALIKEYNADKEIIEQSIRGTDVCIMNSNGFYNLPNELKFGIRKHNQTFAYINSSHYNSGQYTTATLHEKAVKTVKEIDNYCLELQISPDLADIETFAAALIKGLK